MRVYRVLLLVLLFCSAAHGQNNCQEGMKECDWYPWAAWGGCTETCGGNGRQSRNRGICCDTKLEFNDCVQRCNLSFTDGLQTQQCGHTCFNGGAFSEDKCQCTGGYSGKCCDIPPTTPTTFSTPTTTTTTTTPAPTTTQRICQQPLVDAGVYTDEDITSSSNDKGKTPAMAKSICNKKPCGWCPDPQLPKTDQYIEVTLNKPWLVQAIEIQPPEGTSAFAVVRNYMTNYTFQYQPVGGTKLITYGKENAGTTYMLGVRGTSLTVVSTLTEIQRVITQRFRIAVVDALNKACFRFKIFGCEPLCDCENGGICLTESTCFCPPPYYGPKCHYIHLPEIGGCLKPLGMWNEMIQDNQITVSSSAANHDKKDARYNCCGGVKNGGWCPASNDTDPFFEVTLPKPYLVAMLMFQQPNVEHPWEEPDSYMKTFNLVYHNLETGQMEKWAAGVDAIRNARVSFSPVLDPYLFTDVIRIVPDSWEKYPCFRMEIIGCDPDEGPAGAPFVNGAVIGRRRRGVSFLTNQQPGN